MAAKDYKICPALFNAYIAKVSKRNPNQMTDDRRPIEEGEIMMLIDWYLDNELGEKYKSISFESHAREGMKVKLTYIKAEEEKSDNEPPALSPSPDWRGTLKVLSRIHPHRSSSDRIVFHRG